jgi:AcrR family transcriptional regulator
MTQSATTASVRRQTTSRRITTCAQLLADEHGLDGFTMDELADAADVSRRTLFNYFPGKLDAVLGEMPCLDDAVLEEFRAGGPSGVLIDDLGVLADALLTANDLERGEAARVRRIMRQPKLLAATHERFEVVGAQFVEEIRRREGAAFDERQAQVAVGLLLVLFGTSLEAFLTDPGARPMNELYAEDLRAARALFA